MNNAILTAALAATLLAGSSAFAQRAVEAKDGAALDAVLPEQMDASKIYFDKGSDPIPFEQWKANSPAQAEILSLWKGYVEPTIPLRDGVRNTVKKLSVFLSRGKAVLNKPASAINLASYITVDFVKTLNGTNKRLIHQQADPNRLMPAISGKGPNPTFMWCNDEAKKIEEAELAAGGHPVETQPRFTRAAREGILDFLIPPAAARGPWCDDPSRSVCIDSCMIFDYGWTNMVKLVNAGLPDDQKDLGQATQSELRYYASEEEFGMGALAPLTGVNTKVVGVVRQNLFYSNQILQGGTVTAIFQEFPGDPNRLVVSSYFMFTMGTDTVNASGPKAVIKEVLMGRASQFNTADGVTAGLPKFTEQTAASLISILDR